MPSSVYGVIMAGGSGERFWPLSRPDLPKQCLNILGNGTMLQQAFQRLEPLLPVENIFIATRGDLAKLVSGQVPQVQEKHIIKEPCKRDTAACIALAACIIRRIDPDAVMVIVPADHLIQEDPRFLDLVKRAVELCAQEDVLVTFGIPPTEPVTAYGYIEVGRAFKKIGRTTFFKVKKYHEKPDPNTAREYLDKGSFWWNSGIFVWKVKSIIREFTGHLPAHAMFCDMLAKRKGENEFSECVENNYQALRPISIDYGVLQHSERLVVAKADFTWDDLGSWSSLYRHSKKDEAQNAIHGRCVAVDSRENLLYAQGNHLVGVLGAQNLVVVTTPQATLVCPKDRAHELKKLISALGISKGEKQL